MDYVGDRRIGNAELRSQRALLFAASGAVSDGEHGASGEPSTPATQRHVAHVVRVGANAQVLLRNAAGLIARVATFFVGSQGAAELAHQDGSAYGETSTVVVLDLG